MKNVKKDYYKIASYIKSCNKEIQLDMCNRFIELFNQKHIGRLELTFKCINNMHHVRILTSELTNYSLNQAKLIKIKTVL